LKEGRPPQPSPRDRHESERPFGAESGTPGPLEGGDRFDRELERILAAATEVIARDGYERASTRQIASAAGVSLAGLYHYFESKEHLLFLIQFRAFSSLLMAVQSRLSGLTEPAEQLRTLIRTHVWHVARSMATLKVCSHEMDSLTGSSYESVRSLRREYYELAKGVVTRLMAQHALRSGLDPRIATMSLFGALNWLYRWYDPERDRSPPGVANQIYTQFLVGLLGAVPNGREPGEAGRSPSRRNGRSAATKETRGASPRHGAARTA
jgi:AcrR family transcriptional regulator